MLVDLGSVFRTSVNGQRIQAHILRHGDRIPRASLIGRTGLGKRLLLSCLSALLCVAAAEVTSRAFWRLEYGIPFRDPGRILYAFYPELRAVDGAHPTHEDQFYDVLLLGGSVLHREWSQIERDLSEQLAFLGHRNVRVFNLGVPAHASRDSRLKYEALGAARFELIVVYNGINDTRANNAPPDLFRDDYSHFSWYEIVNTLAPYHGTTSFALPYTVRDLAVQTRRALTRDQHVPTHAPRPEWVRYGAEPRSGAAFERNLGAIVDLAAQRGDRVMLMTFATYVPANYSLEAFKAKRLDYGLHLFPIEFWGERDNVLNAIAVQNDKVRSLVAGHHEVMFVDQATLMAGSARYFNDPCHLTVAGSQKFVANLLTVLLARK